MRKNDGDGRYMSWTYTRPPRPGKGGRKTLVKWQRGKKIVLGDLTPIRRWRKGYKSKPFTIPELDWDGKTMQKINPRNRNWNFKPKNKV